MADILDEINDELEHVSSSPDPRARLVELRQLQNEQEQRAALRHEKEAQEAREADPRYWKRLYELEVEKAAILAKKRKEALLLVGLAGLTIMLSLLFAWMAD